MRVLLEEKKTAGSRNHSVLLKPRETAEGIAGLTTDLKWNYAVSMSMGVLDRCIYYRSYNNII